MITVHTADPDVMIHGSSQLVAYTTYSLYVALSISSIRETGVRSCWFYYTLALSFPRKVDKSRAPFSGALVGAGEPTLSCLSGHSITHWY